MEATRTTSIIAIVVGAIMGIIPALGLFLAFTMSANNKNTVAIGLLGLILAAAIVGGLVGALIYINKEEYSISTNLALLSIGASILAYILMSLAA